MNITKSLCLLGAMIASVGLGNALAKQVKPGFYLERQQLREARRDNANKWKTYKSKMRNEKDFIAIDRQIEEKKIAVLRLKAERKRFKLERKATSNMAEKGKMTDQMFDIQLKQIPAIKSEIVELKRNKRDKERAIHASLECQAYKREKDSIDLKLKELKNNKYV